MEDGTLKIMIIFFAINTIVFAVFAYFLISLFKREKIQSESSKVELSNPSAVYKEIEKPEEIIEDPFLTNYLDNMMVRIEFQSDKPGAVDGINFVANFKRLEHLPLQQVERFSFLMKKYETEVAQILKERKIKQAQQDLKDQVDNLPAGSPDTVIVKAKI